jgi:hypothetical protein
MAASATLTAFAGADQRHRKACPATNSPIGKILAIGLRRYSGACVEMQAERIPDLKMTRHEEFMTDDFLRYAAECRRMAEFARPANGKAPARTASPARQAPAIRRAEPQPVYAGWGGQPAYA